MKFFGREDAAGAGGVDHVEDVGVWQPLWMYEPFFRYTGSTVGKFAVADGMPAWERHWWKRGVWY